MHKPQTRGGIADEELTCKSLLIWLHPCSVEKTASCLKEGKVIPFGSNWRKDRAKGRRHQEMEKYFLEKLDCEPIKCNISVFSSVTDFLCNFGPLQCFPESHCECCCVLVGFM